MYKLINIKINCESIGEMIADRDGEITIELNNVGNLMYSSEVIEQIVPNIEPKFLISILDKKYDRELLEEDFMVEFARKILKVHDKFIDIRDENAR